VSACCSYYKLTIIIFIEKKKTTGIWHGKDVGSTLVKFSNSHNSRMRNSQMRCNGTSGVIVLNEFNYN